MRVWLSILVLALCSATARADTVHMIDGRIVEGAVTISADGVTVVDGDKTETIALADVAEIDLASAEAALEDPMDRPGQAVLETVSGQRVAFGEGASLGKSLGVKHVAAGLSFPISAVRAIYLPDKDQTAGDVRVLCEQMSLMDESSQDRILLVGKDGKMVSASGALRGIGPGKGNEIGIVGFTLGETDRQIPPEKVRAILLASAAAPAAGKGQVRLSDGSTLAFDDIELTDEVARIGSTEFEEDELPRRFIASVSVRSDRVTHLESLTPSEVTQHGMLDWTFEYRIGQSASGGPISLDGEVYEHGLGLHSFCELSYDLDEPFTWFIATVGIDDAARPRGDATLTILGDGKVLGEPLTLRGDEKAIPVRLDVAGVSRLTIRVDFGEDELDVADHVDLADARLIR